MKSLYDLLSSQKGVLMRSYHLKSDMEHGQKAKNLLFLKITVKFALLVPGPYPATSVHNPI